MKACVSDFVLLERLFRRIAEGIERNRNISDILISARDDFQRLCPKVFLMYGRDNIDRVSVDVFILENTVLTGLEIDAKSLSKYVVESDYPVYLPDVREFSKEGYSLTTPVEIESPFTYLGIPVPTTYDKRLFAFMRKGYDEFDVQDRALMKSLTDHMKLAIELEGPTVIRKAEDMESLKDRKSVVVIKIENLKEIAKSLGRKKAKIVLKDLIESVLERFEDPFLEIGEDEIVMLLKEDSVKQMLDDSFKSVSERSGVPLKISYTVGAVSNSNPKEAASEQKKSLVSTAENIKRIDMSGRVVITDEDIKRFDRMEKGVVIHNIDSIFYANDRILKIIGISREDLSRYNALSFTAPEYKEMAYKRAKLVLETGIRLPPAVEKGFNAKGEPITVVVDTIPVIYKGEKAVMITIENISSYASRETFEGITRFIYRFLEKVLDLFDTPGIDFWKAFVESLSAFLPDTAMVVFENAGKSLRIIEGRFGKTRVGDVEIDPEEMPQLEIYLKSAKDAYFPDIQVIPEKCPLGLNEPQIASIYGYPIRIDGKVEFLLIFARLGYDSFKPWELDLLRVIGRQLERHMRSVRKLEKIEKERNIYMESALFDPLTGARTRTFLEKWLEDHGEDLKDINSTLVVMDLDCLKYINDVYGHLKGDEMLKVFSKAVMENIRERDIFVRWGGDEFVLILPGTDVEKALKIIERISENLESIDIGVNLSFSYGAAPLKDFVLSFAEADEKLYHMKKKKVCGGRGS